MSFAKQIAARIRVALPKDDRDRVGPPFIEAWVMHVIDELLGTPGNLKCGIDLRTLISRCRFPERREYVQLKVAVRAAFAEQPGEPDDIKYLRSHELACIQSLYNAIDSDEAEKAFIEILVLKGLVVKSEG